MLDTIGLKCGMVVGYLATILLFNKVNPPRLSSEKGKVLVGGLLIAVGCVTMATVGDIVLMMTLAGLTFASLQDLKDNMVSDICFVVGGVACVIKILFNFSEGINRFDISAIGYGVTMLILVAFWVTKLQGEADTLAMSVIALYGFCNGILITDLLMALVLACLIVIFVIVIKLLRNKRRGISEVLKKGIPFVPAITLAFELMLLKGIIR